MHPELMFVQDVKVLYNNILSDDKTVVNLKIQVLKNLQTYLQEEDTRMQEADRECELKNISSFSYWKPEDYWCMLIILACSVSVPSTNWSDRCDCLFREESSQAGRSEGNGRYLIRHEQLHYADIPEAGPGLLLLLPVHRSAFCFECHHADSQPGPHPSGTGVFAAFCQEDPQRLKYYLREARKIWIRVLPLLFCV